ncbi:hypothetical protein BC834DRAFT_453664 [Gloeopeniophorella convolvens]|nr:hypothetical protein BC834DRAFT_453664 [Gloeopeniophorella convolvens]
MLLLNGGANPDTNATIISPASFDVVTSAHAVVSGGSRSPDFSIMGYGLGWSRFSYIGRDMIQHNGGTAGVSAVITATISDGVGIVVLANADNKQNPMTDISFTIVKRLFGFADAPLPEPALITITPTPVERLPFTVPTPFSIWNTTQFAKSVLKPPENITSTCMMQAPEPPRAQLTGTYHNDGYGTLTLCDGTSSSEVCRAVVED